MVWRCVICVHVNAIVAHFNLLRHSFRWNKGSGWASTTIRFMNESKVRFEWVKSSWNWCEQFVLHILWKNLFSFVEKNRFYVWLIPTYKLCSITANNLIYMWTFDLNSLHFEIIFIELSVHFIHEFYLWSHKMNIFSIFSKRDHNLECISTSSNILT